MSNLEVVGSVLLYAEANCTGAIKQAVIKAEAEGNVVVDIIPVYGGPSSEVSAVFLKVAGSTKKRVDG